MRSIKEFILNRFYLLIPLISFLFWPFLLIYIYGFNYRPVDYKSFYFAGKYLFTNQERGYAAFFYLPMAALVFFFLSLFGYKTSIWIFFVLLIIIFYLSIFELNKILILKDIDDKFTRFLILMVFSNGIRTLQMFNHLQGKWITMLCIILFLRREIEKRKAEDEDFSIKFFFIQMNILFLGISFDPPSAFLIIIYVFSNIRLKNILDKIQLRKYFLCIIIFIIQNFTFLIYPRLISIFFMRSSGYRWGKIIDYNIYTLTAEEVIEERIIFSKCSLELILQLLNIHILSVLISLIAVISFIILLCMKSNLLIEDKFGYFMLFSLFLNIFFIKTRNLSIAIPCIILLMIKNIQGIDNFKNFRSYIDYFRNNYVFTFGIGSIGILMFYPEMHLLLRIIPLFKIIPIYILALNWTFIYVAILIIVIFIQKNSVKKVNGREIQREI